MSGSGIGILDGLSAQMKHLNRRQQVVAENLANADTPRYRSRDLATPDFSKALGAASGEQGKIARPTVGATARMTHLGSRVSVGGSRVVGVSDTEEKMNGNNVTVEDEIMKLGTIRTDYSAAASLYRKSINLLKVSIGRGQ